jgi:hypothetical protein
LYLHMEASQHSLLAACFTLHSINATLAIVPQRGAGLWIILHDLLRFQELGKRCPDFSCSRQPPTHFRVSSKIKQFRMTKLSVFLYLNNAKIVRLTLDGMVEKEDSRGI